MLVPNQATPETDSPLGDFMLDGRVKVGDPESGLELMSTLPEEL